MASRKTVSLMTKYGFGINRTIEHNSASSLVNRCRSVEFSLVNFKGAVPLNGGTEKRVFFSCCGGGMLLVLEVPFVRGPFEWVPLGIAVVDGGGTGVGSIGFRRSGSSGAVSSRVTAALTFDSLSLFYSGRTPARPSNAPVGAGRAARTCFSCSYFSPVLRSPMHIWRQSCS